MAKLDSDILRVVVEVKVKTIIATIAGTFKFVLDHAEKSQKSEAYFEINGVNCML